MLAQVVTNTKLNPLLKEIKKIRGCLLSKNI